MTPSLVLFDMDDVLCRYRRADRIAHLSALSGTPPAAIEAAIWDSGFETLGDAGTLDTAEYLEGFGQRIGYPLSRQEWLAARKAGMAAWPEMLALLAEVSARARVAVLTNNSRLIGEHLPELYPELVPLVGDGFHTSASLGAAKPDVAVFARCLAALGVSAEAVLFFDDLAENVAGARAAGLRAEQFSGPAAARMALQRHGVLA